MIDASKGAGVDRVGIITEGMRRTKRGREAAGRCRRLYSRHVGGWRDDKRIATRCRRCSGPLSVGGVNTSGAQPREPFTLALTGDSIIMQRLQVFKEPEFTKLFDLIRGADAAFTNLETLFHDYEAPPAHESGGTWMRTDPPILKELVWAGFDLVSRANNHAGDFGALGAQITSRYVREAGLVEAGVGNSLAEAREAKFLETPKGRVALISAASTFTPHSRAGNTRGDMPARPGLSPLRFTTTYIVTPERLADLRRVASELSGNPPATGDTLNFGGRRYVAGPTPGTRTEPNKQDVEEIARVVKQRGGARRHRDRVAALPRERRQSIGARRLHSDLREGGDRCRRRRVRRARPARVARHRDLQGQADLLQPVELHLPERDRCCGCRTTATSSTRSATTRSRPIISTRATTRIAAAFRPIASTGIR